MHAQYALHAAKCCSVILAALVQPTVEVSDVLKHEVCGCLQLSSAQLITLIDGRAPG